MLTINTPASLFDMAELGGANSVFAWVALKDMWASGETFAWRHNDQLVGLLGLMPEGDYVRAWFNASDAARPHMRFIVRQIRLTLEASAYPEILTICGTDAGRRLAALAGFRFSHLHDGWEIWRYERTFRK